MKQAETINFEYQGKSYEAAFSFCGCGGTSAKSIVSRSGEEIFTIKFKISKDLLEKWKMDTDSAKKFLLGFGKPYTKVRTARNNLVGTEEYRFDLDFASVKPESLVEKINGEWQTISG